MRDPYEILGIDKNATDEEVKAAYREMAKKYHPDNYVDNPLADLADERMKEINEAYDSIISKRRTKNSDDTGGYSAYTNSNFSDIRTLITANRLDEAQKRLDGVPIQQRDAEWYFLNGSVLYKRGWFEDAYTNYVTACKMNPSNPEYRAALNNIQSRRGGFNPYNTTRHTTGDCNSCNICTNLLCADCCCELMGGDLIPCC